MSNLLNFISSFGSSAELRSLTPDALRQKMVQCELTEQEIAVILAGDRNAVAQLVRTSGDIVCCVVPEKPDDEEPAEQDDGEEEIRVAV